MARCLTGFIPAPERFLYCMKFRPWLAINVALKLTNGHFHYANSLPACF
ncbi:hypothetical protein YSA_10763 [Pseudomonas putida ND6]|uniref:Uncharacterized protein n=1 Tax=Pseudomonas putida ND6 TaxID=231023 RepID=I3V4D2_PSEPU|nr:hypothetical protein YSA_10763 [Pseudomonas putida ND6]